MGTGTPAASSQNRQWHIIDADGKVLGRFKVDVAVREGDRVRIGGWRIGDVELGVENGVISRRSEFARADVAAHFHLDP